MTLICEQGKEEQRVQSSISNLEKGSQVMFFCFVFFLTYISLTFLQQLFEWFPVQWHWV